MGRVNGADRHAEGIALAAARSDWLRYRGWHIRLCTAGGDRWWGEVVSIDHESVRRVGIEGDRNGVLNEAKRIIDRRNAGA